MSRLAFRTRAPAALSVTAPTRVAVVAWADGAPALYESREPHAAACTVVAVWPSREVLVWHLTAEQVDALVRLHADWPLDRYDVRVHPDGRLCPCLETMKDLEGWDVGAEVERVERALGEGA
jgi:hypothetical protein